MTKISVILIFCLMTIIFDKSNGGVILMENGITNSNKFNIYESDGVFHCGSLNCPVGSRCILTQKTNPDNTAELITREKCFDSEDNLIQQSEVTQPGDPNNIINQRIETSSGGSYIYNPELQSQIEENVHKTVADTLQNVQDTLHNIFSKPLIPDLNFGDQFPFGPRNSPFGPGFPFNNNYVPLNNEKEREMGKGQVLNPRLDYDISEQTSPPNRKQNTREDIDSDEDNSTNSLPKL